jgi:hypothetical protein
MGILYILLSLMRLSQQNLVKNTKRKALLYVVLYVYLICYLLLPKSRNRRKILVRNDGIFTRFEILTAMRDRRKLAEDGGLMYVSSVDSLLLGHYTRNYIMETIIVFSHALFSAWQIFTPC